MAACWSNWVRSPGRGQFLGAQLHAGALDQFPHPHLLGPVVRFIKIHRAALEPAGQAQLTPTADLVGGAAIECRVHKTLGQGHRMPPRGQPIGGEPRQHRLHEAADQIRIMTLGQHQQAGVVDEQGQAFPTLGFGPADELVARLEMESRRVPGGQGEPAALPDHDVAQVFADQVGAFEVMFADD